MWFLPLLLSGAAIVIALTKRAGAEPLPETAEVPTAADILAAGNIPLLDYYYELINTAIFEGVITWIEYDELYDAYEQRWWELTGV